MEKIFLDCSDYLKQGSYEHKFSSGSLILLVNTETKEIPRVLDETLNKFWLKPKPSDFNMKVYKVLISAIWKIIDIFRFKVLKSIGYLNLQISKERNTKCEANIALIRPNGKIVLFDSINERILTKYVKSSGGKGIEYFTPDELPEYREHRKKLAKNFSLPDDYGFVGNFHIQELLKGQGFSELRTADRISIVKDICKSCSNSLSDDASNNTVSSEEYLKKGFLSCSTVISNDAFLNHLNSRMEHLLGKANSWPMITSHMDLASHNITINNKIPYLLDLAPHKLGYLPAFLMPITLIHSELREYGREDLVKSFWDGEFNEDLKKIYPSIIEEKEPKIDIFIAESLILLAAGSKIGPSSLEYWLEPILKKL